MKDKVYEMLREYAEGGLVSKNAMSDYFLASAGKMTEVEFVGKHKMSTLEFEKQFAEDNNVDISGTEKLSEVNTTPKGVKMDYSKKPKTMAEGGVIGVDPVSGNEIPPGSTPENVRDDIPAMLSEGEYVVPADVLKYFGVNFFEELRMKAKEGMMSMEMDGRTGNEPMSAPMKSRPQEEVPMMAEGGLVDTPSFDPLSFSTPGMSTPGQRTGPSTTEYREYYGPGGMMRMFLFVNGEPFSPIPEGYSATQPEPVAETATPTNSDNDRNDRNPRVSNTTGPDVGGLFNNPLSALDFTDTDAVDTWAADKLERSAVQRGVGMMGLGGALGSTALELRHIAEVSAAAQYYGSIGDVESSTRLMGMADTARENYGVIGSWSEKFSDGDRIFDNYVESLSGRPASGRTAPTRSTGADRVSDAEYAAGRNAEGAGIRTSSSTAATTSSSDDDNGTGFSSTPTHQSKTHTRTGTSSTPTGGKVAGKDGGTKGRNKGGLVTKPTPKPKAKPRARTTPTKK
jgi:hypothetical protein